MTLDERILAYLDGDCSADDVAELERLLAADPAARARFARLCEQDAAMRQILSCEPAAAAPARRVRVRRGWRRASGGPSTPWMPIVFAAAGLFVIVLLASVLSSGSSGRPIRESQVGVRLPPPQPEIPEPRPEPRVEAPKPVPTPLPEPEKPKPLPPVPPKHPDPAKPEPPAPKPEPPAPKPDPKPAPEPKPLPVPAPAPAPKPATEALAVLARLERVKGQVQVLAGTESNAAKEGYAILAGQGMHTVDAESSASIRFLDATQIEVGGETRIDALTNGAGKKVTLAVGSLAAQVTRQQAGQPMIFLTPHAEARVLGTKLTLSVSASETRLEVREGRVRLTRRSDNTFADVGVGQFAVASESVRPVARRLPPVGLRLLSDDFEDGTVDARWQRYEGGFPTTTKGAVDVDVSPRPGDSYAGGGWHVPGGLKTKAFYPAPFRLSFDVEISHQHASVNTLVVLAPKSTQNATRNAQGAVKNELAVRLRNGEYSVMLEGDHKKDVVRTVPSPLQERWTIELDLKEIRLLANNKEVLRYAHGISAPDEYRVELQAAAKEDSPKGSRVRFDSVRIEP